MSYHSKEFNRIISEIKGVIFVDFYTPNCKTCKKMKPFFEYLAKEYPNISFMALDVNQAPEIANNYEIDKVPTYIAFKNGKEIDRYTGGSNEELENFISEISKKNETKKYK
jgi:thioredoxin-like negative regulator of GroEL